MYLIHHTKADHRGRHSGIETERATAQDYGDAIVIANAMARDGGGYVVVEGCHEGEVSDPPQVHREIRGADCAE